MDTIDLSDVYKVLHEAYVAIVKVASDFAVALNMATEVAILCEYCGGNVFYDNVCYTCGAQLDEQNSQC